MVVIKLTSGYRFTIPADTRKKLDIKPGQKFSLSEQNGTIVLVPLPDDPIAFLYGRYKGTPSMTAELLEDRRRDIELEERGLVRAYDEAIASGEPAAPLEQALEEIENSRKRPTG